MKTHYDLLGVDASADAETIKKAFRREIAKYHPDKVTHLGAEFQQLAAERAAELTAAYKVLTDDRARGVYNDSIASGTETNTPADVASPPPPSAAPAAEPRRDERQYEERSAPARRFQQDRAEMSDIVRRATLERVRAALADIVGDCDFRDVRGFDLACIPRGKSAAARPLAQLFRRDVVPNVFVRLVDLVDGAVAARAFVDAVRARFTAPAELVAVLMIGNRVAATPELARAIEDARRKAPKSAETIVPVPLDVRDWTANIPVNTPAMVRAVVDRLKSGV